MRHLSSTRAGVALASLLLGLIAPALPAGADAATKAPRSDPFGRAVALVERSPELRAAETTAAADTTGEVADCRGDITEYGAGYEPSGDGRVAAVGLVTACLNDPGNDPAWWQGYSEAFWIIDTNGDSSGDFVVLLDYNQNLQVGVFDKTGALVCTGMPSIQQNGRFLGAGIDGTCIGSPNSFRVIAAIEIDEDPAAQDPNCPACTIDGAPNSGWGSVTNFGTPAPPPPPPPPPPAPAHIRQGYWMVGRTGETFAFGESRHFGNTPSADVVDLEPTGSGTGYWTVNGRGNVYSFGDARFFGGSPALGSGETVTALSRTADSGGYWLFTNRGRVIAFGNAPFLGDMSGKALNGPVLDSIPTPTGYGYYMVGSDGGIFTFGDASFQGSMGGIPLNAPVQSLVPDPDGTGYWLVASDGGIFAFDSAFYGSMGDTKLNKPVTGMVGFGNGYLMVAEDGGIFSFGDAPFFGSMGDHPPAQPIVSVAILNQA